MFLQHIKKKVFCFLTTASVFYCVVKHLDILWGSTLLCCYLFWCDYQRRRKGTSNVAFEVLITNCQIYFINLFIFNCLTLNIKLFIFQFFDVKFLFSKNHVFRKQKRTAVYGVMDACPQFRILNSPGKMMICYLRDINKFLRHRTLSKSILKCRFPTKGIKLTRFVLFEILGVPQL